MSMSTRGTVHYYDLLDIRQSSVAAAEHTDTGDNITVLFLCVALQYTLGENESIDAIQMPLLMPRFVPRCAPNVRFAELRSTSTPGASAAIAIR